MAFKTRKELDQFEKDRVAANKAPVVLPKDDGSLGGTLTNTADLKSAIMSATEIAYKNTGGARRGIEGAREAGLEVKSPGALKSATGAGRKSAAHAMDIFQRTLDSITQRDEALKQASSYMMTLAQTPELFALMDANEMQFLKSTGFPSQSFAAKVAAYKTEHPEQDTNIITQTDASGTVRGINKDTGEIIWEKPGLGKGIQPPVSVTFPSAQRSFWYKDGQQIGYQLFYPINGETKNFTMEGLPMDAPSDARLSTSSYNTDEETIRFE